jgi:hypothetical protein
MSQDQLIIVEPNGVERARPLTPYGLTIGREYENDLVIGYNLVSRHHATITFEGGRYYITDLNSANGTYLNDRRLPPNQPTIWQPNQPLRIADVVLRLEQTSQPGGGQMAENEETRIGWLPDETKITTGGKQGSNRTLIIVGIAIFLLLACAVVGVGAYFLFAF